MHPCARGEEALRLRRGRAGGTRVGRTFRDMDAQHPTPEQRDERVALPLDPETALRALLCVDPEAPEAHTDPAANTEEQWRPES